MSSNNSNNKSNFSAAGAGSSRAKGQNSYQQLRKVGGSGGRGSSPQVNTQSTPSQGSSASGSPTASNKPSTVIQQQQRASSSRSRVTPKAISIRKPSFSRPGNNDDDNPSTFSARGPLKALPGSGSGLTALVSSPQPRLQPIGLSGKLPTPKKQPSPSGSGIKVGRGSSSPSSSKVPSRSSSTTKNNEIPTKGFTSAATLARARSRKLIKEKEERLVAEKLAKKVAAIAPRESQPDPQPLNDLSTPIIELTPSVSEELPKAYIQSIEPHEEQNTKVDNDMVIVAAEVIHKKLQEVNQSEEAKTEVPKLLDSEEEEFGYIIEDKDSDHHEFKSATELIQAKSSTVIIDEIDSSTTIPTEQNEKVEPFVSSESEVPSTQISKPSILQENGRRYNYNSEQPQKLIITETTKRYIDNIINSRSFQSIPDDDEQESKYPIRGGINNTQKQTDEPIASSVEESKSNVKEDDENQEFEAFTEENYENDNGLTIDDLKAQIKSSNTFSILQAEFKGVNNRRNSVIDDEPVGTTTSDIVLEKKPAKVNFAEDDNNEEEIPMLLANSGPEESEKTETPASSAAAAAVNSDEKFINKTTSTLSSLAALIERLKNHPNLYVTDEDEELRLPTNTPDSTVISSTSSTSKIISQYENLRTLIKSQEVLRKIKGRVNSIKSNPNINFASLSFSDDKGNDYSEEEQLSRKEKWLLFRNGITLNTSGTTESTDEENEVVENPVSADDAENAETIFGNDCESDYDEEQKKIGVPTGVNTNNAEKVVSSKTSEIGIDQIERPSFSAISSSNFLSATASSTEDILDSKVFIQTKLTWLDNVTSFRIQRKPQPAAAGNRNFFFGLSFQLFGSSSIFSNNGGNTSESTLVPLYNVYQDRDESGPAYTVYESSPKKPDSQSILEKGTFSDKEENCSIFAPGPELKLFVNSVITRSTIISEDNLTNTSNTTVSPDSNNNSHPVLTLNCKECSSPDCSLHSVDVFVSDSSVKLGSANFLTCDKETPVLVLKNANTNDSFVVRARRYVPGKSDPVFLVYRTVGLKDGEDYPKDEFDETKDGPCVTCIARRITDQRNASSDEDSDKEITPDDCPTKSNQDFSIETLFVKFSGSLTSETKALIFAAALLINRDILHA